MRSIRLSRPQLVGGSRVEVRIERNGALGRYVAPSFTAEYDADLHTLPEGILAIPCVALLAPVAWTLGARLEVPALDATYSAALGRVRGALAAMYPRIPFDGEVTAERLTEEHSPTTGGSAALFSGGVDSWGTLVAHREERPTLMTVFDPSEIANGSAARIRDADRAVPDLMGVDAHEIVADVREVTDASRLTTRFALEDWWGNVGHAVGLTGVCAPLVTLLGIERLYVPASNYPGTEWLAWGSDPRLDDEITWGGSRAVHDLYELGRQGKLDLLAEHLARTGLSPTFQVCQRPPRARAANCSTCEKCYRTIAGLRLAGIDPARVGFRAGDGTYAAIRRAIEERGIVDSDASLVDWEQLQRAAGSPEGRRSAGEAGREFADFARWLGDAPLRAIADRAQSDHRTYRSLKRASLILPNSLRRPLRRAVLRVRGERA